MKIEWLKPPEVAAELRVSVGTLANWRYQGIGPLYIKLPGPRGSVRYSRQAVDAYLAQQERSAA